MHSVKDTKEALKGMAAIAEAAPSPPVPFRYIICVDFEATCDELSEGHETLQVTRDEQEIIEFPWVVLDVASLALCESKQLYIKPENTPVTPFCTELTGITADTLECGVTFAEAVREFADFVETRFEEGSFVLCAHGKWDLSQLRCEALRKGVELRPWMHNFIDLRSVFRYWAQLKQVNIRGTSLQNMCDALGITLSGRLHSGIDDATTIANCLACVIRVAKNSAGTDATFPSPESWLESKLALEASGDRHLILSGLAYDACMDDVSSWLTDMFARIQGQNLAKSPPESTEDHSSATSSAACPNSPQVFSLPEQVVRADCIVDQVTCAHREGVCLSSSMHLTV